MRLKKRSWKQRPTALKTDAAALTHTTENRIGIFGGSFDPPHIGHLIVAQTAISDLNLKKVLFIPAAQPPHKPGRRLANAKQRLEMVNEAIANNACFEASHLEIDRQGVSYSIDTIKWIQQSEEYAGSKLFLIIGADNFLTFRSWRAPDEILRLCQLAVYPRVEHEIKKRHFEEIAPAVILNAPRIEISSSHIRASVQAGKSIKYLVPQPVEEIIVSSRLYLDDEPVR